MKEIPEEILNHPDLGPVNFGNALREYLDYTDEEINGVLADIGHDRQYSGWKPSDWSKNLRKRAEERKEKKLAFQMNYHESNDLLICISAEVDGKTMKLGEYHKVVAEVFADKLNEISRNGGAQDSAMQQLLLYVDAANKALRQLYSFDVTTK